MTNEIPPLRAAQDYLAAETLRHWRTRRITISSPVEVPWSSRVRRVLTRQPPARRGRGVGPGPLVAVTVPHEGVVTRLREQVYDQPGMDPRRIAVWGGPGTGKTTAMQLLLIDVLRHRARDEPVPVWLTCRDWNPHTTPLLEWVAATMVRDYPGLAGSAPGPRDAAAELIHHGYVALFLDGLDEMPPAARAKALPLIHRAPRMCVVLSSRRAEYGAAHRVASEEGDFYPLSAAINILPVDVPEAETFLLAAQPRERRRAWQPVIDHLRRTPRQRRRPDVDQPAGPEPGPAHLRQHRSRRPAGRAGPSHP